VTGRSPAFWAGNRYHDEAGEPKRSAPLRDLPPLPAARFRALRSGLLALDGVVESVRFMGATWRWAWEYGIGTRKLCWIHFIRDQVSATFTLSEHEEHRLRQGARLASQVLQSLEEGQRTGPVRWCWLELADRRSVDSFLTLARRKAAWLAERSAPHRVSRVRGRSVPVDEEADSE